MQTQPLVSVIIPCYKQAHFLGAAIESVLAQTYPQTEIVVIDDGSPDETSAVAARYPGVRCVRQTNQGLSAARNRGIQESRGAYISFLDADDLLTPDGLAAGVQCLAQNPGAGFVFGTHRAITEQGELFPTSPAPYAGSDLYHDLLRINCIRMVSVVMYRRAVFDQIGGFDSDISPAADYDLYLRAAREFQAAWHRQVVAYYRIYQASMSHDYAIMLRAVLLGLRKQHPNIQGQPQYQAAYRAGREAWWQLYGEPLYWEATEAMRAGRAWRKPLRDLYYLGRYHPQGLTRHLGDKLTRMLARNRNRTPLAE